ncbi:MAG: hypothetical protein NDJ75_05925 [Thermoanaerobaculia bacterium]|nr:hypothetical protein [Thermoanaerobaculia bacterium]
MIRLPSRTALAALAALALFAALGATRHLPGALRGDEGTYVAMTASLARDGDLRFTAADEAWARARPQRPAALILERTAQGVAYSKPILYPLLAAPFYAVAGDAGFWLFHALALTLALLLARAALARRAGGEAAGATVVLFACGSTVVPYLAWRMTESLQVALATAGLALALGAELVAPESARRTATSWAERRLASPAAPWAGMALLGLLVALREPNAAVAAVPVLAALAARRPRRAVALTAIAAASYAAVVLLTWTLTGAPNPYKAPRATFNGATGYPLAETPEALARFDAPETLATSSLGPLPRLEPARTAYAALYFLGGRHSGLFVYFPAALALLWAARRGGDRAGGAALAGFAATAAFYLVYWPANYFGGETCIGNRYLLAAYPCLLFAPARLPSARARRVAWALGFLVAVSALVSVRSTRTLDGGSQNHAYAGLFRVLPYESTASHLEGRTDRYWTGDFVRFVDPFAEVDPTSFRLVAGRPPAELEIATAWTGDPLRLLVVSDAADATLEVSDWLRGDEVRLGPHGAGAGGPVDWRPSPAWRVHPFWWSAETAYRARTVRLRLVSATPGATARVRYLGRHGVPAIGFEREVESVELPATGIAGRQAEIPIRVVHRGTWPWSSRTTLPVLLTASLVALDGSGGHEVRGELPGTVRPGQRLETTLALRWPERPGRYRVTVDLVLEDVAWFADRLGEPLATGEVTVTAPPSAAEAAAAPVAPPHP